MGDSKIRVLITGAGAPGGPGLIKSLLLCGDVSLVVGDINPMASGRALCDDFLQLPSASGDDYIPRMLDICSRNRIEVLIPLVTRELLKLSGNKKRFALGGTLIAVSEPGALEIANDKAKLFDHLSAGKIDVPAYRRVKNLDTLKQAVKELGYPQRDVVIKPAAGNGSRGIRILTENRLEFDAYFQDKPDHMYSNLEEIIRIFSGHELPEMLVMEYLPGEEWTVDCFIQKGNPVLLLPRRRLRMNAGISVAGEYKKDETILAFCKSILKSLELDGPVGIQVKMDSSGKPGLLEINPRLQGTSCAAMGLGINLASFTVKNAMGEDVQSLIPPIQWGKRFVRYYSEAYFDSVS
ncbi:MAG: ATP-grasp domain-containing protein [Bacteroidetes bacterium]|nr:ATP-grasp domain-containing protein [Bacteroidota bacterium]